MIPKKREIEFKPRIKLNHNIYATTLLGLLWPNISYFMGHSIADC